MCTEGVAPLFVQTFSTEVVSAVRNRVILVKAEIDRCIMQVKPIIQT